MVIFHGYQLHESAARVSNNWELPERTSRINRDEAEEQLASWCSWLSLLSNTQAVPGSSPGEVILFLFSVFLFVLEQERKKYDLAKQSIFNNTHNSN